jgi:AraC-like DNA-binding protein
MENQLYEAALEYAMRWGSVCAMNTAVFDYVSRSFLPGASCGFCIDCGLNKDGRCDHQTAHSYNCYEAERWNGLFVYFCPISLAFVSTVIYKGKTAMFAIVSGPFVMGTLEDAINDALMVDEILSLPRKTPSEVNSLSQIQWSMCMYLSGRAFVDSGEASKAQSNLHNTLYDLAVMMQTEAHYPLETEHRLQQMITRGDKQGAQELINQLLGAMYFSGYDDFPQIRQRAKELVILFSRASIDGGADMRQIFGKNRDYLAEVDECQTLESLSALLTSIFHRFVGYAFDFRKFEHSDIMHKTLRHLRENLSKKLTVEECAERSGISRSYFSTMFKNEMGVAFSEFVNNLRIDKSKELLVNTSLSLAEIADMVGYSDQSYFTKKFLQITGVTPGQYKKSGGRF